ACGRGLGGEIGLAGIDVGDGEGAAGGDVVADDADVFGDVARSEERRVGKECGSGGGEGEEMEGGSVGGGGGEAVGDGVGCAELLDGGFSGGGRHARWPRGCSSDVCSSDLACGRGLGGEIGLAGIDVGDGEGAAGGDVVADDADVFGDVA